MTISTSVSKEERWGSKEERWGSKEERWGSKEERWGSKEERWVRYTAHYQQLNVKTIGDVFPLPLIKECIDTLADNQWFNFPTLDLVSGYWEIMVNEHNSHKMAFLTKYYGLSEHIRMAQGLCSAPATLQRVMIEVQVVLWYLMNHAFHVLIWLFLVLP